MSNSTPEPGEIPWLFGQDKPNDESTPGAFEDADAAESPTQLPSEPPPLPPQVDFSPLDPSELSERELRDFKMELTLHKEKGEIDLEYYKLKREIDLEHEKKLLALRRADLPEPPKEYEERNNIWLLYFKLLPSLLALGVLLWIMWGMFTTSLFENWWTESKLPWWIITGVLLAICVWFNCRTYVVWNTTLVVCNMIDTGVKRPANSWLLIGNKNRMMKTVAIQGKDFHHPWILRVLHINSWWVNFSTPSDDEKKVDVLENKHFIRNADKLASTINAMQAHLALTA